MLTLPARGETFVRIRVPFVHTQPAATGWMLNSNVCSPQSGLHMPKAPERAAMLMYSTPVSFL